VTGRARASDVSGRMEAMVGGIGSLVWSWRVKVN
jgi:hypothetical protein